MNGNQQRHRVIQLATTDTALALAAARFVEDPWYACQSLAHVARYAPESQVIPIADEALRVCRNERDPYRIVAPAAWPVRALVERDRLEQLDGIIRTLLVRGSEIELFASRSEALFLLFQAVFPAGRKYWRPIFDALWEASEPMINWRQRRNLGHAILIIDHDDETFARQFIDRVTDLKLKTKIEKGRAKQEAYLPRPFFWTDET